METILNICVNKEVVHEKHDIVRMATPWEINYKNGCKKEILLARNEI
jgi:hypothetical protein